MHSYDSWKFEGRDSTSQANKLLFDQFVTMITWRTKDVFFPLGYVRTNVHGHGAVGWESSSPLTAL